jgi:hypothetical protein
VNNTFVRWEREKLEKPISYTGKGKKKSTKKASQKMDAKRVGV